jgi:hypothetical protein
MTELPKPWALFSGAENTFAEIHKSGSDSIAKLGVNWIETLGDLNAEAARFIAQRIAEDVDTQHKMLHCKSLKDFQHLQLDFFQTAMMQYEESAARMLAITTKGLSGKVE